MSDPTMLPALADQLDRLAAELAQAAAQIRWYVPKDCDRDDLVLEAYNRTGGASAEAGRAARALRWAIRKERRQDEHE